MKNTSLYTGIAILLVVTAGLVIYKTSIAKPPGDNGLTVELSGDQNINPTNPNNAG